MNDPKPDPDTMKAAFGPQCYVVRGTDSNGGTWLSRKFVSACQYPTLDLAKRSAERDVDRMNALGASVEAVLQTLSDDGWMWEDNETNDE